MKEYIVSQEYIDGIYTDEGSTFGLDMQKELIRCKDCKHWLPHTQFGYDADYEEYHNYCNRHLPDDDFYAFIKEEDDFCSWAERKGI